MDRFNSDKRQIMRGSTFGKVAVLFFVAVSLQSFGGEVSAAPEESPLTISCVLVNDENYVGMPLPVEVVVSNVSDRAVVLFSRFGRPYPVVFKSESGTIRKKPPRTGAMSTPIDLSSKASERFVFYPNRTIKFTRSEAVKLNYEITVRYRYYDESYRGGVEEIESGALEFKLKPSDPVVAKKYLEKEMERLKSDDPWIRVYAAEAICFMDGAAALGCMKEIVDTQNDFEQVMILESIWYNESAEADEILLEMLQPDGSDKIVRVALDLLSDRDVEISRQTMEALLASGNSRIRLSSLWYIKKKNLSDYLDLVRDLVDDEDEKVAERATEIIAEFEGTKP